MPEPKGTETPRRRRTSGRPSSNGTHPAARIPPHNLDAEESLLGAAMLDGRALEVLVSSTEPEDFYKPSHAELRRIMGRAHAEGWDPDPVAIWDRVEREGLSEILDKAHVVEIVSSTPAVNSAPRYARIVGDHATLRRLLYAAAEITELAYALPDDAAEAVARARSTLATIPAVGASLVDSLPFADVHALLDGALEPDRPDVLERVDGASLFYSGRMNTLQGDPSCGKTWVAMLAARQMLELGGTVLLLDYEDTATSALARLVMLGTPKSAIRDRLRYLRPTEAIPNTHIVAAVQALNVDLLVIDSVAEALNTRGYSEDRSDEVLRWLEELPRPATRVGTTVLMLDHVVKSKEERGRWARGSGAKLGAQDGATYAVRSTGFNQRTEGRVILTVAKDRHGGLDAAAGEAAASIRMVPHDGGQRITATIERPIPEAAPPTPEQKEAKRDRLEDELADKLKDRIVEVLEDSDEPLSKTKIRTTARVRRSDRERLRFPDRLFREALEELATEHRVVEQAGPRGADVYALPPRQVTLDETPGHPS